jgi:hypothetical protein
MLVHLETLSRYVPVKWISKLKIFRTKFLKLSLNTNIWSTVCQEPNHIAPKSTEPLHIVHKLNQTGLVSSIYELLVTDWCFSVQFFFHNTNFTCKMYHIEPIK